MNIDITKIEGYEAMSAEEKVKALEAFSFDDLSEELKKAKDSLSKANSEAADWKRKHNALLSDDQKKQQETAEKYAEMEKELQALKKEKTISEHKAKFIGIGLDEELATATATAMADGDMATVFGNFSKFMEKHDKELAATSMKNTPTPPAGAANLNANYAQRIADANARGDYATAAALTRMQQQNTNK